jgi:putative ABC transport system substrate-binding protein
MPTIGIIHSGSGVVPVQQTEIDTFILSLKNAGYTNGQGGFSIRPPIPAYANDNLQQLRAHADNFVRQGVDVLVAAGGSISAQVAKDATAARGTPVVFTSVADPVSPAPNMTGICARTVELDPTRLILLHELMPAETTIGALISSRPQPNTQRQLLDNAANVLGLSLDYKNIANPGDIPQAFRAWHQAGIKAAVVTANPFFNNHGPDVINHANNNNIAAIYQWHQFVDAGGLMSYGTKLLDAYNLAGIYVGLILDGQQPQALPVVLLTKFEISMNLTTAKKLDIAVPKTLHARADNLVK